MFCRWRSCETVSLDPLDPRPLTLALTLAACSNQTPAPGASTAQRGNSPAGAVTQEYAATPILPISTLPETPEKQPELRERLKKEGRLDGLLARAAQAQKTLGAQAAKGSCKPTRWVAEGDSRVKVRGGVKCSVPFTKASLAPDVNDTAGNEGYSPQDVSGDGVITSASTEVSVPHRPNWVYFTSWFEFVELADGSYWFGPADSGNYYTSSSPGIAPRTPQTLSGATFKQGGDGLLAAAQLTWTYPPPTTFLADGNRIYDVTGGTHTKVADKLYVSDQDETVVVAPYKPGLKRSYQVCVYNREEELCSNTLGVQWDGDQAPLAAFSATPGTGHSPQRIDFDASASRDLDGRIVSYEWDFSDYTPDEERYGVKTSHLFRSAGKYRVRLTVTDAGGNKGEFTGTVNVVDPAPNVTTKVSHSKVNGVTTTQVNLSWTPAHDIAADEYRISRSLPSDFGLSVIATLPASATSYTDDLGAITDTYALYRVCGVNLTSGSTSCNEGTFAELTR